MRVNNQGWNISCNKCGTYRSKSCSDYCTYCQGVVSRWKVKECESTDENRLEEQEEARPGEGLLEALRDDLSGR